MAHLRKGFMGGFTGRIGDKIGYIVNGVQYVRSAPKKRPRPVTAEQMIQREKFSMMTKFLAPAANFINEVHKHYLHGKTGYSKLFSLNYKEALTGEYPDFAIDFNKLRLTTGLLAGPEAIHVSCGKNGFLNFHWADNSRDSLYAGPFDLLYLAFYDEDEKSWEIKKNVARRRDGSLDVDMSQHRGNRIRIYTGFTSSEGRRVSNSHHLGMINIL